MLIPKVGRILPAFTVILVICMMGFRVSQSMAQDVRTSREDVSNHTSVIKNLEQLSADLEAIVALQKEQLGKMEESIRRTKFLLEGLKKSRQPANTSFNKKMDNERHNMLPSQNVVNGMSWKWFERQASAEYSVEHVGDGYEAILEPVLDKPNECTIRLSQNGNRIFSWRAHTHTVFLVSGNILYWADFNPRMNGCAIVAFDLKSRNQVWKTQLWGIGSRDHSQYNNLINLTLDGRHLVVYGSESFGRYIELVDAMSGHTVGHKIIADRGEGELMEPAGGTSQPRANTP